MNDLTKENPHVISANGKTFVRNALFEWAYMGNFYPSTFRKETLEYLSEKALKGEAWRFDGERNDSYSILDNYLRYTFYRIQKENKIEFSKDGIWAIFNTGLVNKTYLPIYSLFQKNRNEGKQPWYFCGFIAEGEKWGRYPERCSVADFPRKPRRAQYFDDPAKLLYIVSEDGNELSLNFDHIFDRADRLPIELLKDLSAEPVPDKKSRLEFTTRDEYIHYLSDYNEELQDIINNGSTRRKLQERFRTAVELTRDKILWNYKTAIPMYYPRTEDISLLLPLSLVKEDEVDLALVVSKGDGGYLAETIYPLNWAYKCARLICRPNSDWLTPSAIRDNDDEDNDEDIQ